MKKIFFNISRNSFSKLKKIGVITSLLVGCNFLLSSCSRDDEGGTHGLKGTIYFEFGGKASYYQLNTDTYREGFSRMGVYSSPYDDFDISWDNQKILFTSEAYSNNRYFTYQTLQNFPHNKDNRIFRFRMQWNSLNAVSAYISPNEKYIAVMAQTAIGMPILVMSSDPKDNTIIEKRPSGGSLPYYGNPIWTNDNSLYYRMGTKLYKSVASDGYRSNQELFSVGSATNVTVSPNGQKVAFRKDKHLWLCNIDGSGLRQITTSETSSSKSYDGESYPTFSPDSQYIVFQSTSTRGAGWSDTGTGGTGVGVVGSAFGYLAIIPANGKLYNLDQKNNGVIYLKREKGAFGIPTETNIIWR